MALTVQTWQDKAYRAVIGALPSGPPLDAVTQLVANALLLEMPDLWAMAQSYPGCSRFVHLRFVRTKILAFDEVLGLYARKVDARLGRVLTVSESQKFRQLESLKEKAEAEYELLLTRALRSGRVPVYAELLATAPGQRNQPVGVPPAPPDQPRIDPVGPEDPGWNGWAMPRLSNAGAADW